MAYTSRSAPGGPHRITTTALSSCSRGPTTIREPWHLGATAYSHAGPADQRLGLGHTLPTGQPWVDGSPLDHPDLHLRIRGAPDSSTASFASVTSRCCG